MHQVKAPTRLILANATVNAINTKQFLVLKICSLFFNLLYNFRKMFLSKGPYILILFI